MFATLTKRIALLLVVVVALSAPSSRVHAQSAGVSSPAKQYYLALGASFAFGYQEAKLNAELAAGTYSPESFNTGYVDDFAQLIAADKSNIQVVNYSCPGETAQTFINGGCAFHVKGLTLHNDYPVSTSQLSAAVSFLTSHPHQVRIITISLTDLVGNGLSNLYYNTCNQDIPCVVAAFPGFLAQAQVDSDRILTALQTASPSSEIIVLQEQDPYLLLLPASVPLFQKMNAVLAAVATAHKTVLADGVTPFTPDAICTLSAVCAAPLHDIHPTDAGYQVLARVVYQSVIGRLTGVTPGSFTVAFPSSAPGQGNVYFGTGPGCQGLVETATRDLAPGTMNHSVTVMGNDLPGSVGDNGILPGVTYWYELVSITSSGQHVDDNNGACYSVTIPSS